MTRRRLLRGGYAVAVLASAVYQALWPGLPPPTGQPVATVPRQGAAGPPVELAYQDHGSGPVLVLLHGSPGAVADFRHLLPHLTGFRVLVPDLPGFGRSSRWLPDYSVAAHARYVLDWLDGLGVGDFQVVGFSQGSGVALHLADLAPDRVRSVTLFGGIGIQEGEGSGSYRLEHVKYALMVPALVAAPELVPHFGLLGSRSFRWTFFRNFWDTDQRPLRGVIERLRPPLLVLHGRRDPLVPAWAAVEHHRLAPAGELHLFPDSHFMLFAPEPTARLAAKLVPFLERGGKSEHPPAEPPDLPNRTLWPVAAQVGMPAVLAAVAPVAGGVLTGGLAGGDRVDPFAGWLGCLAGGLVRRRKRAGWWLAGSAVLVVGTSAAVAAGWLAAVAWLAVVAVGRAWCNHRAAPASYWTDSRWRLSPLPEE